MAAPLAFAFVPRRSRVRGTRAPGFAGRVPLDAGNAVIRCRQGTGGAAPGRVTARPRRGIARHPRNPPPEPCPAASDPLARPAAGFSAKVVDAAGSAGMPDIERIVPSMTVPEEGASPMGTGP